MNQYVANFRRKCHTLYSRVEGKIDSILLYRGMFGRFLYIEECSEDVNIMIYGSVYLCIGSYELVDFYIE